MLVTTLAIIQAGVCKMFLEPSGVSDLGLAFEAH